MLPKSERSFVITYSPRSHCVTLANRNSSIYTTLEAVYMFPLVFRCCTLNDEC